MPDHCHFHVLHQRLESHHRHMDLSDANSNDMASAIADQEETDADGHFLHWPCVCSTPVNSRYKSLTLCPFRTCVVSALRLTVVLGHGSPNFTWYYVPLGMYSVFEPLGGILCSNLPIIWHMMRKRKAMLPCTKPNSSSHTPTIGSGSLRSRVARSLGLTSLDSTQSASCNMTTVDHPGQGEAGWRQTTSMENDRKPDPNIWTTIERVDTGKALSDAGSSAEPLKPGMKKTVWNVRK
jgi:hypothetical protein